jgi:hypothetical protein
MPLPLSHCVRVSRSQPVARRGRRGARATHLVAFRGPRGPESAYNLAGAAGQDPGCAHRL